MHETLRVEMGKVTKGMFPWAVNNMSSSNRQRRIYSQNFYCMLELCYPQAFRLPEMGVNECSFTWLRQTKF